MRRCAGILAVALLTALVVLLGWAAAVAAFFAAATVLHGGVVVRGRDHRGAPGRSRGRPARRADHPAPTPGPVRRRCRGRRNGTARAAGVIDRVAPLTEHAGVPSTADAADRPEVLAVVHGLAGGLSEGACGPDRDVAEHSDRAGRRWTRRSGRRRSGPHALLRPVHASWLRRLHLRSGRRWLLRAARRPHGIHGASTCRRPRGDTRTDRRFPDDPHGGVVGRQSCRELPGPLPRPRRPGGFHVTCADRLRAVDQHGQPRAPVVSDAAR